MNRGDIVLITFPFSNLKSTKVRPALVLSPEDPTEQDFIVALISSNAVRPLSNTDYLLLTSDPDFAGTELKVDWSRSINQTQPMIRASLIIQRNTTGRLLQKTAKKM